MIEITARVSALAPEAASALEVVAYFDRLVQGGAGVNAIVRGAAVLSGRATVFADQSNGLMRAFSSDGTIVKGASFPVFGARVSSRDGSLRLGAEAGDAQNDELTTLILERALLAVSTALGRPLDARPRDRSSWVRLLIDDNADSDDRSTALRSLDLTETTELRLAAVAGGDPIIATSIDDAIAQARGRRAGVGRSAPASDAAVSWAEAVLALRLTAEGTTDDPGDRMVVADDAGVLLDIVAALGEQPTPPADVRALARAREHAPWVLGTIDAVTRTNSLREAAALVYVHHSTLSERLSRVEQILGWSMATPQGRARASVALALWRALRPTAG